MALITSSAGDIAEVGATTKSLRVTPYPIDVATRGAYVLAMDNGTSVFPAGALTGSEIFQFRWRDTSRLCLLRSVKIDLGTVIAYAAGKLAVTATIARSFTAVGSGTGSATPTLTGNNNKKRTTFGTTLVNAADIVIAGTAALSAGTKTLDSQAFSNIATAAPTTIGPILTNQILWQRDSGDEWPIILAADEGFTLKLWQPGTGTMFFGVDVEWIEVDSY